MQYVTILHFLFSNLVNKSAFFLPILTNTVHFYYQYKYISFFISFQFNTAFYHKYCILSQILHFISNTAIYYQYCIVTTNTAFFIVPIMHLYPQYCNLYFYQCSFYKMHILHSYNSIMQ